MNYNEALHNNINLKVAVITGGSSGIGRGIAQYLVETGGYKVILVARGSEKLTETREFLREINSQVDVETVALDVSDHDDVVKKLGPVLDKFEKIDLLVNSAGYVKRGTSDLSFIEFDKMVKTNLMGPFNMIHLVATRMKQQQSGRIINIASISGVQPRAELGGYAASKSGLMAFNESLYRELAPFGIYVTAICPNLVATEMTKDVTTIGQDEFILVDDVVKVVDTLLSMSPAVLLKEVVLQNRAKFIQTL